ncbi:MAG: glycosyltransferase family 39 protein [Polyangiaceae bacterium]|nr:glycosyltransferase family 39 protein [Polyangiaceae bacterium]
MSKPFAIGLGALALAPRLYTALAWARAPVWDGELYARAARHVAAGWGYGHVAAGPEGVGFEPACHYPVGYPGLLGLVYRLFGDGERVAPLFGAFVGAALAVVTYALARRATSERRARVAGVLVAVHPGLVAYAPVVMTEPVAALFVALGAWLVARHRGGESRGRTRLAGVVAAGLAIGLGTLVRPATLWCAPALGLFELDGEPRTRRRALATAALASTVALATVVPWTVRNCVVMDGCAVVSANAGWNLAIGAMPRATGRYEPLRPGDGCGADGGEVALDRCWARTALAWIAADPGRWLALAPKKLHETFDHESFPIGYLAVASPQAWPEPRARLAKTWLGTWHRLLLVGAALGLVHSPFGRSPGPSRLRRLLPLLLVLGLAALGTLLPSHPFWPLALAIPVLAGLSLRGAHTRGAALRRFAGWAVLGVCVVHVIFFGEDRYHVVVSPLLCLLAALALERREPAASCARTDR